MVLGKLSGCSMLEIVVSWMHVVSIQHRGRNADYQGYCWCSQPSGAEEGAGKQVLCTVGMHRVGCSLL
jgi:hypothetical protein